MAFVMETLSRLPAELQEKILREISNNPTAPPIPMEVDFDGMEIPIEIDDDVFLIHQKVFDLIDSLCEQVQELRRNGIPENKRH